MRMPLAVCRVRTLWQDARYAQPTINAQDATPTSYSRISRTPASPAPFKIAASAPDTTFATIASTTRSHHQTVITASIAIPKFPTAKNAP